MQPPLPGHLIKPDIMPIQAGHEEWRAIPGFEQRYEASNLGRVRSVARTITDSLGKTYEIKSKILRLSQRSKQRPYLRVGLFDGNKLHHHNVHRIVARCFIGQCPKSMIVLHGIKGSLDNSVTNLRYGTHKQNSEDKVRDNTTSRGEKCVTSKLKTSDVLLIRKLYAVGSRQVDLAKQFGVEQTTISRIVRRRSWAWLAVE